jgi:hypothetical protein
LNWSHSYEHACSATNLSGSGEKNMGMIMKRKASLPVVESGGKGEWEDVGVQNDFQSPKR